MKIGDTSTPVVTLACPYHGGLGVTRSLGKLGISVYNVDSARWAPARFSRYCRGAFVWDIENASPEQSVKYLSTVARQIGRRSLLIPGTDRAAVFVANHGRALEPWYIFPAQNPALADLLATKMAMCCLALENHIPTPTTLWMQTKADRMECLKRVNLPIIVKGIQMRATASAKTRKLIVRTPQQLLSLYDLVGDATVRDMIAQEYIPGSEDTDWMFNGYFNRESECLIGFTGRKLRQCPAYTGVTSLGLCQKNVEVEQAARKFLKGVAYCGIVDMDFRYDARDGHYKLLDVNPRIGCTFRLFLSKDGMDVVRAAYLDLTGQPVHAEGAAEGRKWVVEDFDLVGAIRYFRDRKLRLPEWLRSFRGIQELAFFALDDPLPTLLMMRADATELFRRVRPSRGPSLPAESKHRATSASPDGKKMYSSDPHSQARVHPHTDVHSRSEQATGADSSAL
jgi:D-aspartate ligase